MAKFIMKLDKEERKKIRNGPVRSIVRFSRTMKYPEDHILDIIVNASTELAAEEITRERERFMEAITMTKGIGPQRAQEIMNNVEVIRAKEGEKDAEND